MPSTSARFIAGLLDPARFTGTFEPVNPLPAAREALRRILVMDAPTPVLSLAHEALRELELVAEEPPLELPGLEEQAATLAQACSSARKGVAVAVLRRAAGILQEGSFKGGYRGPSRFGPPAGP